MDLSWLIAPILHPTVGDPERWAVLPREMLALAAVSATQPTIFFNIFL